MQLSAFGEKLSAGAGILSLMDDLGHAMAEGGTIMMGGGNPGHVPAVQEALRSHLRRIADDGQAFRQLVGIYDPPQGAPAFLEALATLLREQYGWQISADNICITNGSQGAFFLLFNILAGRMADGSYRKLMLPLAPEYIGYADLGIEQDMIVSVKPRIEVLDRPFFKYRVDFDQLKLDDSIGALCVSRPTNPTGNVLTNSEIQELARLASAHQIPLIVDSAYGLPFPGMVYTEAEPFWNEQIILCLSLSKLGLPAARTGIVIGRPDIIKVLSGVNAVANLAPGSFGAMLVTELIRSREILRLSQEVVRPYYQQKMARALEALEASFAGIPYRVHVPEGAFFLWLWFEGLPISCREVYQRLKAKGVLIVSGDYFFPGLADDWPHMRECIRLTYSQDEEDVRRGIAIIASEIRALMHQSQP